MVGIRHVWATPEHMRTAMPGLVLGWQKHDDQWEALVTYVMPRGRVVTEWLPREQLQPVKSQPRLGTAYG